MDKGTSIEILAKAIQFEIEGHDFYERMGKRTKNIKGKALFSQLAKDETRHANLLIAQYNSLKEKGGWIPYSETLNGVDPEEMKRQREVFTKPIKEQKKGHNQIGKDTDDIGALRLAISQEEEASGFYKDAEMGTDDSKGKVLYSKLAEMEKKHITILKAEYDSLSNSGFWCDFPEFTMESME